ncbi:GtrA family protein [Mesorhizobium marinum]|uniref:GtrA family protein n=1 Tax=Mesorhizobium marinum TaxID=3228790 RepID=UPI0034675C2F
MDRPRADARRQFARYLANGIAATAAHYSVLVFLLEVVGVPSAGAANFVAAVVGITVSFLGSRYFVFEAGDGDWSGQLWRFVLIYAMLAVLHAGVLFVWTDRLGYDFRIGFLIATGLQVMISFVANRTLVFAP